jgi:SAM-dependent methyltransferase
MIFHYKNKLYPSYIKDGDACSFIEPFAKKFCVGNGLDIGGTEKWKLSWARDINITKGDGFSAEKIPSGEYDFIFSSHTLEHVENYVRVIEYWTSHIKSGGVLFLYLPHEDMEYWLPQNNRKHLHSFRPDQIEKVLKDLGYSDIISSGRDLYWSFSVIGFKP